MVRRGRRFVPVMKAWPMGFRSSATVAHRLTEKICVESGLPAAARAAPSVPCLLSPPIWGAIMDDVWAVTTDETSAAMVEARSWLPRVEECWRRDGVPSHPRKAVDEGEFEDIQGALLHPTRHGMGLAPDKLAALMFGALQVTLCRHPARQSCERVVRKCSHVHCFRPCLRSSFQMMHRALHDARARRESRLDFQAPWARRVVCSDAAPGGHGLAYAFLDERTVVDWGRVASHRGDYTSLLGEVGLEASPVEHSHLKRAELPLDGIAWKLVGRLGRYE